MDGTHHVAAHRDAQRMSGTLTGNYGQGQPALPDNDFLATDFVGFCTQIGSKAVLLPPEKDNANDAGEMEAADVRNGQHQRALRKAALGPYISLGKRISPVALRIADGVPERIGRAIDRNFPIYPVAHTENAVPALHKGNVSEGAHNVIGQRRKVAEPKGAPEKALYSASNYILSGCVQRPIA